MQGVRHQLKPRRLAFLVATHKEAQAKPQKPRTVVKLLATSSKAMQAELQGSRIGQSSSKRASMPFYALITGLNLA